MRWLWYSFLGLVSLGMLGMIAGVFLFSYVISYYSRDLPAYDQLKDYEPPVLTRIYAGDGRLLAEYAEEKRVFVPVEAMPDIVKQSFIAAEDQNFYRHNGIDFKAIARAALRNIKNGGRPEGASTITQQVAKNFLLTNEVSYERKIREAILATRMERAMSKDRLLELYLNEIYLGQGSYGVAAASLNYFNKALEQLEIHEIAYLAALPKAPNNYHPVRRHDAALARRNWVIGRMLADNYITRAQAEQARAQPLSVIVRDELEAVSAPYFAEEVRREIIGRFGQEALYHGGLVVRTSLDARLQKIAETSLRNGLMAYDRRHGWRGPVQTLRDVNGWEDQLAAIGDPPGLLDHWRMAVVLSVTPAQAEIGIEDKTRGTIPLEDMKWARKALRGGALGEAVTSAAQVLKAGDVIMVEPVYGEGDTAENITHYSLRQIPAVNGGLIAIDPHTGRVLAMQGGWSYAVSEFNRATQATRQPGSAFKPFVYLAALEKGFTPSTLVLDAPFAIEQGPGLPLWRPTNYSNQFYGPTPIRVGIEKSRNLMTVRLAHYVGMEEVARIAKSFGVMEDMPTNLANSLGAWETTLLKLTTGYAQMVNGGRKLTPTLIDRVQDRQGQTVFLHDDRPCRNCGDLIEWQGQDVPPVPDTREQIADPRKVYQMVSILEGVVQRGTATRIRELDRPLAGKTGTTNDSKDTWFIGFSPDLTVGVFVGFDEPRNMGKRETGGSVCVPIFRDFMDEALRDEPAIPFRIPPGIRQVMVNPETGARAQPGDRRTIWEAFLVGTEPGDTNNFILDGSGLNVMRDFGAPPVSGYEDLYDGQNPYMDGDEAFGSQTYPQMPNPYMTGPAVPPPAEAGDTIGTGGLY